METIAAKSVEYVADKAKPTEKTAVTVKISDNVKADQEVLVHDGHKIVIRHDSHTTTATGDPNMIMLVGTKEEIDDEIKRLGLTEE